MTIKCRTLCGLLLASIPRGISRKIPLLAFPCLVLKLDSDPWFLWYSWSQTPFYFIKHLWSTGLKFLLSCCDLLSSVAGEGTQRHSACFAYRRPWVRLPVLQKKKKIKTCTIIRGFVLKGNWALPFGCSSCHLRSKAIPFHLGEEENRACLKH